MCSSAIPSQPLELFRWLNTALLSRSSLQLVLLWIYVCLSYPVYLQRIIEHLLTWHKIAAWALLTWNTSEKLFDYTAFPLKSFEVPTLVTVKIVYLRFTKIQWPACIILPAPPPPPGWTLTLKELNSNPKLIYPLSFCGSFRPSFLLTCENEFLLRVTTHQFWYYTYYVYVHILIFKSDFFFFGQKWIIPNHGGSSIIIIFPGKTHSTSSWSQQIVPSIQVLLLKITVRDRESHNMN